MTLGLYDTQLRRRRRVRWATVRWVLAIAAVVGAAGFAYEVGSSQETHRLAELQTQIGDLSARLGALQQRNTDLQANVMVVEERLRDAQKGIPTGPLADLLALVREKLDAGVEIERMQFLIGTAVNAPVCPDRPVSKRFMVQTLLFSGTNDSVNFADNRITVTARGESTTNAQGQAEAWFDPAQPIKLILTQIGGKVAEVAGKLPLHTSVVIGDEEHRFTATMGEQGFVQVTGERCRLK
jgi:hypothetical protein